MDNGLDPLQYSETFEPIYQYNHNVSNIGIDNSLAAILDKFDPEYMMDAIRNSVQYKFRPYDQPMPNIVYGYEQQFIALSNMYQSNKDDIAQTRKDTYENIIDILCDIHNLSFNPADDTDYFSAAFYLYQFLITNFTPNIINFFVNYLIKERDQIYQSMRLCDLRKNDAAMAYSRKLFKDEKIGMIHGNIHYVLTNMQDFDIDLYSILELVYPANQDIARYIYSLVSDKGNFFKDQFISYALDPINGPSLQTEVKLLIQKCAADIEDINPQEQKEEKDN